MVLGSVGWDRKESPESNLHVWGKDDTKIAVYNMEECIERWDGNSGCDAVNLAENDPSLVQMKTRGDGENTSWNARGKHFILRQHCWPIWIIDDPVDTFILHIFLNEHSVKTDALESMFILKCWVALHTHPRSPETNANLEIIVEDKQLVDKLSSKVGMTALSGPKRREGSFRLVFHLFP